MLFCISSLSAPSPRPLLFPPLRPRFSYQRLKAISFLKNAEAIFFVLFRAKIKFFSFVFISVLVYVSTLHLPLYPPIYLYSPLSFKLYLPLQLFPFK